MTTIKLDFYQFPAINPDVELAEDAPTDTFHIPANATNKDAARAFLQFVVSADVQTTINNGANLGQLPVNATASVDDDKFLNEGFEMLSARTAPAASLSSSTATSRRKWPPRHAGLPGVHGIPDNLDDILAAPRQGAVSGSTQ